MRERRRNKQSNRPTNVQLLNSAHHDGVLYMLGMYVIMVSAYIRAWAWLLNMYTVLAIDAIHKALLHTSIRAVTYMHVYSLFIYPPFLNKFQTEYKHVCSVKRQYV